MHTYNKYIYVYLNKFYQSFIMTACENRAVGTCDIAMESF